MLPTLPGFSHCWARIFRVGELRCNKILIAPTPMAAKIAEWPARQHRPKDLATPEIFRVASSKLLSLQEAAYPSLVEIQHAPRAVSDKYRGQRRADPLGMHTAKNRRFVLPSIGDDQA